MAQITLPASDQESRARLRVGLRLQDRWCLEELIGVGGMAAVYRASHKNGRSAAIKILHIELSQISEIKERFLDEGYASNQVKHPGTVQILDDGVGPDGAIYLVMELLDGETLEERLSRCGDSLPVLDVLALVDPLLEVVVAAHKCGIVHRDIKPENIFLTRTGTVKLLDFGIARMPDSRRSSRTQSGATLGTPAYMSPEQARGRWEQLDARSDLFSVGATMFTLLTGQAIHQGETLNELLLAAMTVQVPSVAKVAPHLSREIVNLVDRALQLDPNQRFQTAEEMLQAVQAARLVLETRYSQHGYTLSPPVAGQQVEPMTSRDGKGTYRPVMMSETQFEFRERRGWWPVGIACLLAAGAVLTLVWTREIPDDAEKVGETGVKQSSMQSAVAPELRAGAELDAAPHLDAAVEPDARAAPDAAAKVNPAASGLEPKAHKGNNPARPALAATAGPPQSSIHSAKPGSESSSSDTSEAASPQLDSAHSNDAIRTVDSSPTEESKTPAKNSAESSSEPTFDPLKLRR